MNIEREMQKALKVIFQNIQALDENRNEFQGTFHDPALTSKRWRPKKKNALQVYLIRGRTISL